MKVLATRSRPASAGRCRIASVGGGGSSSQVAWTSRLLNHNAIRRVEPAALHRPDQQHFIEIEAFIGGEQLYRLNMPDRCLSREKELPVAGQRRADQISGIEVRVRIKPGSDDVCCPRAVRALVVQGAVSLIRHATRTLTKPLDADDFLRVLGGKSDEEPRSCARCSPMKVSSCVDPRSS